MYLYKKNIYTEYLYLMKIFKNNRLIFCFLAFIYSWVRFVKVLLDDIDQGSTVNNFGGPHYKFGKFS